MHGKVKYLLGFNVPDNKDQANMRVDGDSLLVEINGCRVAFWKAGCVHADREWMQDIDEKRNSYKK